MRKRGCFPFACIGFAVLALSSMSARAERRCGWIENPTPANYWVSDKDGQWVLSTQGQPETPGMDLMPDLSAGEYVATNRSYGYGCGCVDATFKDQVASRITAVRQLPLASCKRDPSLPAPGQ